MAFSSSVKSMRQAFRNRLADENFILLLFLFLYLLYSYVMGEIVSFYSSLSLFSQIWPFFSVGIFVVLRPSVNHIRHFIKWKRSCLIHFNHSNHLDCGIWLGKEKLLDKTMHVCYWCHDIFIYDGLGIWKILDLILYYSIKYTIKSVVKTLLQVYCKLQKQAHTNIHTWSHVFGLYEKIRVLRWNSLRHGVNMQTPYRKPWTALPGNRTQIIEPWILFFLQLAAAVHYTKYKISAVKLKSH